MDNTKLQLEEKLSQLHKELEEALKTQEALKEELESFLSQFTCVLDAPSCGCSEDELNDPKYDALFTEQDRLTKESKSASLRVKELNSQIAELEASLTHNF